MKNFIFCAVLLQPIHLAFAIAVWLGLLTYAFSGLLTDGRKKIPSLKSCHKFYNDETWHSYTLP